MAQTLGWDISASCTIDPWWSNALYVCEINLFASTASNWTRSLVDILAYVKNRLYDFVSNGIVDGLNSSDYRLYFGSLSHCFHSSQPVGFSRLVHFDRFVLYPPTLFYDRYVKRTTQYINKYSSNMVRLAHVYRNHPPQESNLTHLVELSGLFFFCKLLGYGRSPWSHRKLTISICEKITKTKMSCCKEIS